MKRIVILLLVLAVARVAVSAYQSPFEVSWERGRIKVPAGQELAQEVIVRVPAGHFLYKDKTELVFTTLEGINVKKLDYPQATGHFDVLTNKSVEIYPAGDVLISFTLKAPGALNPGERQVAALLKFQGCEEKLCLRPEEHELTWNIDVVPSAIAISEEPKEGVSEAPFSVRALLDKKDFHHVVSHGRNIALLIAFIAGILTSFSPCVWPLIPVTLLIVGIHKKGHILGNLGLSASLVAGIALTYSILGVVATAVGNNVGFLFQKRAFLIIIIMVLVAMSTALLGLWTFQLPVKFQNFLTKVSGRGYRGSFLSGASLGLLATPCAGPILIPMLLWVAAEKEYLFGAELLALYAAGMGIFYIIIGTFYGTLSGRIRNVRIGNAIKKFLGIALLVPAAYYLMAVIPLGNGLGGDIKWQASEPAALVEAVVSKRPLMLVFGAKWCPSCEEIKGNILSKKEFADAAEKIVPLYVDVTVEEGEAKRLMDKYKVIGMPTILFVSPEGRVYDDLSVVGSEPTLREMMERVEEAVSRSSTL